MLWEYDPDIIRDSQSNLSRLPHKILHSTSGDAVTTGQKEYLRKIFHQTDLIDLFYIHKTSFFETALFF